MAEDLCFLCRAEVSADTAWRCAAPNCACLLHRDVCLAQYVRSMASNGQYPAECPNKHAMPVRPHLTLQWARVGLMLLVRAALAELVYDEHPWQMLLVAAHVFACIKLTPHERFRVPVSWYELAFFALVHIIAPWLALWRWFPFTFALFYALRLVYMPSRAAVRGISV